MPIVNPLDRPLRERKTGALQRASRGLPLKLSTLKDLPLAHGCGQEWRGKATLDATDQCPGIGLALSRSREPGSTQAAQAAQAEQEGLPRLGPILCAPGEPAEAQSRAPPPVRT